MDYLNKGKKVQKYLQHRTNNLFVAYKPFMSTALPIRLMQILNLSLLAGATTRVSVSADIRFMYKHGLTSLKVNVVQSFATLIEE